MLSISIVTESSARQGKQHHKRKLLFCVLQSLLDCIAGWVGVIDYRCFSLYETERSVCVLVCHHRLTVDSEDEVRLFIVKVTQSSPGASTPYFQLGLSLIIFYL